MSVVDGASVTVAAVVLAAGSSARLGRPKQLFPRSSEAKIATDPRATLLGHTLDVARVSRCAPVAVVLGAHAEEIEASILSRFPDVARITNVSFAEGMASSIRAAARWASDLDVDGLLLLVCDQPRLDVGHLERLVRTFATARGERCVGSMYAASIGVPAVFPRSRFHDLFALEGDRGAKAVLRASEETIAVDWPDGAVDIDTDADARAWRSGDATRA